MCNLNLWSRVKFKSYRSRFVRVWYDLNLTRECHIFYYLAPFTVVDSFSQPFLPCQWNIKRCVINNIMCNLCFCVIVIVLNTIVMNLIIYSGCHDIIHTDEQLKINSITIMTSFLFHYFNKIFILYSCS
jgi:hypothetical protein